MVVSGHSSLQVMDRDFDIEIGLSRDIMRIFGMWPKNQDITAHMRFVISIGMILGFCNIPQTLKMFEVTDNFDELLEVITRCNLPIAVGIIKTLIFWFNNQALVELIDAMDADWKVSRTKAERKLMQKNAKLGRLVTIIVLGAFLLAVVSFLALNGSNRMKEAKIFSDGKINASERWRPLYFLSKFPYDVQKSPHYEIIWFFQFFVTIIAATTYAAMDGLFSALVFHLCAQMEILRGRFAKLLADAAMHKDKYAARIDYSSIVERHEFLMWFAETIETIFNLQFLLQFLISASVFCLTGYQIVKIITADVILVLELIFSVYYYFGLVSSIFAYALIATILSTESTKIRDTAYECEFYKLSPSDTRLLILIMIRTQKPFELTVGKFATISLELYCNLLKTSGGYLSILMAMKDRLEIN